MFVSAFLDTSLLAGPLTENGQPTVGTRIERVLEAGFSVPFFRVRRSHQLEISLRRERREDFLNGASTHDHRHALRAGWGIRTARRYGYSISDEHGFALGTTTEWTSGATPPTGNAATVTGDLRVYLPARPALPAHHVIALRAAGGLSVGHDRLRRAFHLGGGSSQGRVIDYGRQAFALLRGFSSDSFAGTRIAALSAEYRWPITRPQRGVGTMPLFLHTVHAALFADAAHTWVDRFRPSDAKLSLGGELSTNLVAGYSWSFTLAVGGGWGRDGAGLLPGGTRWFIRLGPSF